MTSGGAGRGLVALTALVLLGCGREAAPNVAPDVPPASAPGPSPPTPLVSTSVPPTAAVADRDALVTVGPLPEGWDLIQDASPTIPGDPVRILLFRGPPSPVWGPPGQTMVVDAAYFTGMSTDGRAGDLTALAQLGLGAVDGSLGNRRDITVQGRSAAAFDHTSRAGTDTVVVSTVGDWRVHVRGKATPPDVVLAFAELVVVA